MPCRKFVSGTLGIFAFVQRKLAIERGSPWKNGYIESFNARLRDELLNGEIARGTDRHRELRALADAKGRLSPPEAKRTICPVAERLVRKGEAVGTDVRESFLWRPPRERPTACFRSPFHPLPSGALSRAWSRSSACRWIIRS